jgi:hypothetical protein
LQKQAINIVTSCVLNQHAKDFVIRMIESIDVNAHMHHLRESFLDYAKQIVKCRITADDW